MVTHFPAFAQEEYTIPRYIPTHFVRGSNKTAEISTLTSLLLKKYTTTIKKARLQAKQTGVKIEDVEQSIKTVRSKDRAPKCKFRAGAGVALCNHSHLEVEYVYPFDK